MELQNPNTIATSYKNVISAFKKRYDVQNGSALGYRKNQDPNNKLEFENWPKTIGQGLTTTGFCVTASQALLLDNIFQILLQDRGAMAKLISIDIKEQYYGHTYSGHQNKWHTAILVQDSGINLVVDITCAQFGNRFVGKEIWDFETWERTFRSPLDKHIITDFTGSTISYLAIAENNTSLATESKRINMEYDLHDITTITDEERNILSEFFTNRLFMINRKLEVGNINKFDYGYIDKINKLIKHLDFVKISSAYSILKFTNKDQALKWIKNFMENDGISQSFLLFSDTFDNACKMIEEESQYVNIESSTNEIFVVLELINGNGLSVDFIKNTSMMIPYGIKLNFDMNKDVFNGGKLHEDAVGGIAKQTNAIYIKCSN